MSAEFEIHYHVKQILQDLKAERSSHINAEKLTDQIQSNLNTPIEQVKAHHIVRNLNEQSPEPLLFNHHYEQIQSRVKDKRAFNTFLATYLGKFINHERQNF